MEVRCVLVILCCCLSACNPLRNFGGGTLILDPSNELALENRREIQFKVAEYGRMQRVPCETSFENHWLLIQCKDKKTIFNIIDGANSDEFIVIFGQEGSWLSANQRFCKDLNGFNEFMLMNYNDQYVVGNSTKKCAHESPH